MFIRLPRGGETSLCPCPVAITLGPFQTGIGTPGGAQRYGAGDVGRLREAGPIFDASRLGMVANREGWILSVDCASEGQGIDRQLESRSRRLKRTRGSHLQYVDPHFGLVVTAAGHPNQEGPPGTLKAILRTIDLFSRGEDV